MPDVDRQDDDILFPEQQFSPATLRRAALEALADASDNALLALAAVEAR